VADEPFPGQAGSVQFTGHVTVSRTVPAAPAAMGEQHHPRADSGTVTSAVKAMPAAGISRLSAVVMVPAFKPPGSHTANG
jgi:hypothetical protein